MPTAKFGYFLKDGSEIPSVTTVTSRFKESGGLIHWAWDLGRRGLDYRAERDNAADAGTLAHHLVEQFIRTGKTDLPDAAPDVAQKALLAFDAFRSWQAQTRLTIVAQEIQLVSEKYRFGGTPTLSTTRENHGTSPLLLVCISSAPNCCSPAMWLTFSTMTF